MKRRLEIARALIHRPSLLVMDEPTTGLDPHAFARIWQRLRVLQQHQGMSILVSTHSAEEAAQCHRLLVLDRGHIVSIDTPEGLLGRVAGDVVTLTAEEPEALAHELSQKLSLRARVHDGQIWLREDRAHELIPRIVEAFPNGRIHSVNLRRPTLADAFLEITGRRLDDDGVSA
jgi:ABC-2 type transport system ATP-binding protein